MNKTFIIIPLLGLLSTACSNDLTNEQEFVGKDSSVKGYIKVNLVAPGSINTRDDYKDGETYENYVQLVRFYFFDNNGDPVYVRKNPHLEDSYYSYYDWDPTKEDNENATGDGTETVEKVLNTTIMMTSPEDYSTTPAMLMAVLNPSSDVLSLDNPTKADLNKQLGDYKTGLTNNNFVMTNSVYVDDNGSIIDYTPITSDNIATTITAAQENPLVVYVERVVARLDLTIGGDDVTPVEGKENVYDTGITFNPVDDSSMSEKVYVKFLGWNVTSTPTTSRLVKQVDSLWPNDIFNNSLPWNSDDFHRSFWAVNPETVNYEWCSYNEIYGGESTTQKGKTMSTSIIYMQENANPFETVAGTAKDPEYPTQVIVAGQLVDSDGKPLTIAEYNQQKYTLSGLKTYVANHLNLFTANGSGGYVRITPDQLTFMTSSNWKGESGPDQSGTYFVYFVLNSDAAKLNWFTSQSMGQGTADDMTPIDSSKINQFIYDSVNRAMVWNEGATYYYFTIRHLGALGGTGFYGVVRNHIYDAVVNKLTGLGTPVYDPTEVIYPEEVDNSGNLIAAQIRILQWRIVNGSYEFSW